MANGKQLRKLNRKMRQSNRRKYLGKKTIETNRFELFNVNERLVKYDKGTRAFYDPHQ